MKKKTGPKPDGIKRIRKSVNVQEDIDTFIRDLAKDKDWSYSQALNYLCEQGICNAL